MSFIRIHADLMIAKGGPKKHGGLGENKCGPACPYLQFRTGHGDFKCTLFDVRLNGLPASRNVACKHGEKMAEESERRGQGGTVR